MPKNIVVCCDDVFSVSSSNVVRLYSTLKRDRSQAAFFYPGVEMRSAPFGRTVRNLVEFSTGLGVFDELRTAYRFLMNTYEPGDKLFLFGAGRGGYTVRMLAGMLNLVGLLDRGSETLVPWLSQWRVPSTTGRLRLHAK